MKIVAANYADSLRGPDTLDTDTMTLLETVREELRGFYGAAEDDLPADMTALARRLDGIPLCQGHSA